jgi:hypothetical protein
MFFGRITVTGAVAVSGGGWTIVQDSSDASDDVAFWGYRDTLAAGTEDGTTITITHGNGKIAIATMAIAGTSDPAVQAPEASTVAIGSSINPNPTTCTPTGGAKDYMWIWFGSWEGESTLSKTPATNYSDGPDISTGTSGITSTNCQLKTGTRALNAASEDAGTITISSSPWTAWTIAVHPAGGGITNADAVTATATGVASDAVAAVIWEAVLLMAPMVPA